jgi:hypothetical protein
VDNVCEQDVKRLEGVLEHLESWMKKTFTLRDEIVLEMTANT